MKSVIVGTAGHVDHGKTALIEALTGVNTDRWEEERRRGITIDIGFAPFELESQELEISVVDVPGHEDFVKNMLAGATGVDLLLVVVAADEGPMPQTREHLSIARLLGVKHGVAAVTKSDLVDADWRALVVEAVREELETVLGSNEWPVVPVSAMRRDGLTELREALLHAASRVSAKRDDDLFRLPVDRSFTVRGVGTVVTGTVWSGRVQAGMEVDILPGDRRARVRGVQAHGGEVAAAWAGQRAALALVGVDRADVGRGDTLTVDPIWRSSHYLDVWLELLSDSRRKIRNWQRLRFHLGTAEMMARVVLYERDQLQPGEAGLAQLRLERPAVARSGDRFVVRFYSPITTIGGGVVLDPWASRRSRLSTDEAASLQAARRLDVEERLAPAVAGRPDGVSALDLAVIVGANSADIEKLLRAQADAGALREVSGSWFAEHSFQETREAVLKALAQGHARDAEARGVSLESLRSSLDRPVGLVNAVFSELAKLGAVRIDGAVAALPEHVPQLKPQQQEMAEAAVERIRLGRLMPPALKELAAELRAPESQVVSLLKFMARDGRLVAVTPDLYFDSAAIKEAKERLTAALAGGRAASPSELRRALEISRKYLIPLLEHLDAAGFTRRTSQGRVLRDPD